MTTIRLINNQQNHLSAAVLDTQSLQIKQDKEEGQLQVSEKTQAIDVDLEFYIEKFEKHQSIESLPDLLQKQDFIESIPLDIQKKLLEYYKNNVKSTELSLEKAKEIVSQGGCPFVPPYALKNLLQYYQNQVATLTTVLAAHESELTPNQQVASTIMNLMVLGVFFAWACSANNKTSSV